MIIKYVIKVRPVQERLMERPEAAVIIMFVKMKVPRYVMMVKKLKPDVVVAVKRESLKYVR